jgi:uncharacterized protein
VSDNIHSIWTLAHLRSYREQILALAEAYGAYDVRVFGSVARGEATPDSDIDILVCFPSQYKLLHHSGLLMALKDLLAAEVDVSVEANLHENYRATVLKDAIPL